MPNGSNSIRVASEIMSGIRRQFELAGMIFMLSINCASFSLVINLASLHEIPTNKRHETLTQQLEHQEVYIMKIRGQFCLFTLSLIFFIYASAQGQEWGSRRAAI